MDLESKLNVFQEFLDCAEVRLWHFNGEMRLLSGQDDGSIFETLFRIGGGKQLIHEYSMKNDLPGFCSDAASLLWLAIPQHIETILTDVYVIGPVFGSVTYEQTLLDSLRKLQFSDNLVREASSILEKIPTVQHTLLVQYGVMLYRCLTDVKLDPTDLQLITNSVPKRNASSAMEEEFISRDGTYALEQQLFQAVENGNIHYQHPQEIFSKKAGVLCLGNPLRHAKNQLVACLTLITRAAIRGGMPEEMAYSLSDWYIQMSEATNDIAEVYQYSQEAFKDFTKRVHKLKLSSGRSKEIQECMSYIELHFQQCLTLETLAKSLGYSKNYLSSKFTREVGMSISDYITHIKMEHSKLLLKNTNKSIQEISDELGYNSISYFSALFRKQTGFTPTAYRNRIE